MQGNYNHWLYCSKFTQYPRTSRKGLSLPRTANGSRAYNVLNPYSLSSFRQWIISCIQSKQSVEKCSLFLQFVPNAVIFFIVLVMADRSRDTIQSIGFLVSELDQKLRLFQVSYNHSQMRIKRLSLFASFGNNLWIRAIAILINSHF